MQAVNTNAKMKSYNNLMVNVYSYTNLYQFQFKVHSKLNHPCEYEMKDKLEIGSI